MLAILAISCLCRMLFGLCFDSYSGAKVCCILVWAKWNVA